MDTSKLKPFDLARALAGDPVCFADGQIVSPQNVTSGREYQISIKLIDNEVVLMYEPFPGMEGSTYWYAIGLLFMAPKTREVWVNLYDKSAFVHGEFYGYESEDEANRCDMSGKRLGNCAHKIIIEE